MSINVNEIDWEKAAGLVPAIIQDAVNLRILMLGFMNQEALHRTIQSRRVTFYSRSRQTLWVKGESSGNYLNLVSIAIDCDRDTLLVKADPQGPVCHTGTETCFNDAPGLPLLFLERLKDLVKQRNSDRPQDSYTTQLFESGPYRLAQKVGEEGLELALASVKQDRTEILDESADLIFHILVLLESRGLSLDDVCHVLLERHGQATARQKTRA